MARLKSGGGSSVLVSRRIGVATFPNINRSSSFTALPRLGRAGGKGDALDALLTDVTVERKAELLVTVSLPDEEAVVGAVTKED